jgi:hypothetical protein
MATGFFLLFAGTALSFSGKVSVTVVVGHKSRLCYSGMSDVDI